MLSKAVAILALVILPMSAVLWLKSHDAPRQYRFDITLYKSLRVYLKDGTCGLRLLSLPTKTASRSEFNASLDYNARQMRETFALSSTKRGSYRVTWLVFPLWFPTVVLALTGTVPILSAPPGVGGVNGRVTAWSAGTICTATGAGGARSAGPDFARVVVAPPDPLIVRSAHNGPLRICNELTRRRERPVRRAPPRRRSAPRTTQPWRDLPVSRYVRSVGPPSGLLVLQNRRPAAHGHPSS